MIYLFRKKDGAILSKSAQRPLFKESATVGLLETETNVPAPELVDYFVTRDRELTRWSEDVLEKQRKIRQQRAADAKALHLRTMDRLWELLEKSRPTVKEMQNALKIVAQTVFPKG